MTRILLLGFAEHSFTETQLDQLRAAAPDMQLVRTNDRQQIEAMLADEEAQVEIVAGALAPDLLPRARHLRWYQQWGAGADWLFDHPALQQMDFILTNASGVHAVPISEHIIALLLAFARDLPRALHAQTQHVWISNQFQRYSLKDAQAEAGRYRSEHDLFELADKTLLLLGVGGIGARTVRLAAALDMRVIGVRRDPGQMMAGVAQMVGPDQLLAVLPEADFVVITIPLTPETRGLFDRRAFAAMRANAYLINIGRGEIVVEPDLIEALQAGRIAGAGLDVFADEPLPPDSPLWDMDNVIVTSHYAGLTPRYDERALAIFLDNLHRYRRGEPLRNVVDKMLGY